MTSADFLNYSVGIAIWALIGLSIYIAVSLVRLFDHIRSVTKVALTTAMQVQMIKGLMKLRVFKFLRNSISMFWEGGAKNG